MNKREDVTNDINTKKTILLTTYINVFENIR